MADVIERVTRDEPPAAGVVDEATVQTARDIRAYVASHSVGGGFRTRLAERLQAEGVALHQGRRTTRRAALPLPRIRRTALAVTVTAAALVAVTLALVRPDFLFGGSRLAAAEVLRRHEARITQPQRFQPDDVLHTVTRMGRPEEGRIRESWQLVGADGLVVRSFDRMEGPQGTLQRWFDGDLLIIDQQPTAPSAGPPVPSVYAAPMAPYRPVTGLGLLEEVGQALMTGSLVGGTVAGAAPTPVTTSAAGAYRVTGRGQVAGRATIVVENDRTRAEFDAATYDLLALTQRFPAAPNQQSSILEAVVISQAVVRGGATALPAAALNPPAVDRAEAAVRPPMVPPYAPPLAGLPAYLPPGLQLLSTSTRNPDAGPMGAVLSAAYRGPAGEVYIQRAPPMPGCGALPGKCRTGEVNGRPALIRTTERAGRPEGPPAIHTSEPAGGQVWHWLHWDDDQGGVLLYGTLPLDELLQIARSLPLRPGGAAPQPPPSQGPAPAVPGAAPGAGASVAGDPTAATEPVDFLGRFMEARRLRQESWVHGSLADPLATAVATTPTAAAEVRLLPESNPCWNAWELVRFEQSTPITARARVRVFEYARSDDTGGGQVQSWDQELALRRLGGADDGPWRVAELGPPENGREYPNAPREPATAACQRSAP